ncbi:MAG: hypothetical protein EBT59_03940, partial [Betaproteobacteria bacterium]|nr:hypothetical protein [Betaproteobacteria bacterium]
GAANDVITGTSGADYIVGNAGNDLINGGAGTNTLIGGTGIDTIIAGPDSDVFIFGQQNESPLAESVKPDRILGFNFKDDEIRFSTTMTTNLFDASATLVSLKGYNYWDNAECRLTVLTDQGTFAVDFVDPTNKPSSSGVLGASKSVAYTVTGTVSIDSIIGGAGNDVYVYPTITQLIASSQVVDSLIGGGGFDTIRIDQATTYVIRVEDMFSRVSGVSTLAQGVANSGNISITLDVTAFAAGIRTVTLSGDTSAAGANTLYMGAAALTQGLSLVGSAGQDSITGGAGDDTITGGAAADVLIGGPGNDRFVYTSLGQGGTAVALGGSLIAAGDTIAGFESRTPQSSGLSTGGSTGVLALADPIGEGSLNGDLIVLKAATSASVSSGLKGEWNLGTVGVYIVTGSSLNFIQGTTTSGDIAAAIGNVSAPAAAVGYIAILDNQNTQATSDDGYYLFEVKVGLESISNSNLSTSSGSTISLIAFIESNILSSIDFLPPGA